MAESNKHKTTIYWAERAILTDMDYTSLDICDGIGYHNGNVVCIGNFDAVERKRKKDHINASKKHPERLPIWC